MEVLVEFDYVAEEPDELTIKKGDIIKDVSQFEEGWYIGNLNGKVGVFPDNFVKTIEAPTSQKRQVNSTVETVKEPKSDGKRISEPDYEDNRTGSVSKTQRVTGIGLGNIFSGQPIQLKQTSLKDVIKDNESNSDKTLSVAKGDGSRFSPIGITTDHVRARYDYQPKQPDELELHVDDLIQVLDRNLPDEGWWKGKNLVTKKVGVFPDNFVVPVQESGPEVDEQTQQSATVNTAPEPPKIAAKPSPLGGVMNNQGGTRSISKTANSAIAQHQHAGAKLLNSNVQNLASGRISTTATSTSGSMNTSVTASAGTTGSTVTGQAAANAGPSLPASGRTNRWRTSSEHSDQSKPRTVEDGVADIVSPDAGSDGSNQRLAALTADRPRQTGRRLPSKFNRPASPTDDGEKRDDGEIDTVKRTIPMTSSQGHLTANHSTTNHTHDEENTRSDVFESSRGALAKGTEANQRTQRVHITGLAKQSRVSSSCHSYRSSSPAIRPNQKPHQATSHEPLSSTGAHECDQRKSVNRDRRLHNSHCNDPRSSVRGSLYRNEGTNGSADLNRSQEALTSKNKDSDPQKLGTTKLQSQIEQLQAEYNQHLNESRQQMRDMRRQIEQLKEANSQMRADMLHSQRIVTDRIQTLMNELDEAKKQRAADAVELARLRTVLMQLDAKAIMTPTGSRTGATTPLGRHRKPVGDRGGDDNDGNAFYDDGEDDNSVGAMGVDISEPDKIITHGECGINKNGDMQHTGLGKTGPSRNSTSAVRARDANLASYSRS